MWPTHQRSLPPSGLGILLARRLSQMQLLRMSTRRSRFQSVHQSQFDSVQKRLSQVIWLSLLYWIKLYVVHFFFLNNSFWFNKRLFGATGNCAACCKPIPAFEMVMRAKSNVYHLDCFACQQCHQRWFIFYYNTISSNILHTDLYFNIFNIFIQRGYQPWTEWKCKKKQKQIAISVS